MPMITQRERLGEIVRQRFETAEVSLPARFIQLHSDALCPMFVAEARDACRKTCRLDWIVEIRT